MNDSIKNLLNATADFLADPEAAVSRDFASIATAPSGGANMADMVWLMTRTVATGKQLGGTILDDDELAEARRRLYALLDIAVAGGWRGIDLLETLMARGIASDRLEALARKAGRYADNRPDLLKAHFDELFGRDTSQYIKTVTTNEPRPEPLPHVRSVVKLRKPMAEHYKMTTIDGEEQAVMTVEATLMMMAQIGHDPAQAADCNDGGGKARASVEGVLKVAKEEGYSRMDTLRAMLTSGPYGRETMAAIEHLTGELGTGVIVRGMKAVGFNFRGA